MCLEVLKRAGIFLGIQKAMETRRAVCMLGKDLALTALAVQAAERLGGAASRWLKTDAVPGRLRASGGCQVTDFGSSPADH